MEPVLEPRKLRQEFFAIGGQGGCELGNFPANERQMRLHGVLERTEPVDKFRLRGRDEAQEDLVDLADFDLNDQSACVFQRSDLPTRQFQFEHLLFQKRKSFAPDRGEIRF